MRYPSYESRKEHEYYHSNASSSPSSSTSLSPSLLHQLVIKEAKDNEVDDPNEKNSPESRSNKKLRKWKKQHQLKQKRLKPRASEQTNIEFTLADWQCVLGIMALKQSCVMSTPTHQNGFSFMPNYAMSFNNYPTTQNVPLI
jgi:hypothetical protein